MHRLSIWLTALCSLLLVSYAAAAPTTAAVSRAEPAATPPAEVDAPPGFTDTVVNSVPTPTGMAWTPDGRMLVTQDNGQIRVVAPRRAAARAARAQPRRHGSARKASAG